MATKLREPAQSRANRAPRDSCGDHGKVNVPRTKRPGLKNECELLWKHAGRKHARRTSTSELEGLLDRLGRRRRKWSKEDVKRKRQNRRLYKQLMVAYTLYHCASRQKHHVFSKLVQGRGFVAPRADSQPCWQYVAACTEGRRSEDRKSKATRERYCLAVQIAYDEGWSPRAFYEQLDGRPNGLKGLVTEYR